VCCSVLQCVAVCCSVLQCVAVCCSVLQCVEVWCSVLRCVAVCCIVGCSVQHPRRIAQVCCSVLQCVAKCSRRTGWRRPIGCLKLQVIFRKRATNYRALAENVL